jgi:citrate synthase
MAGALQPPGLTAAEVADILGIKRQTVYAYVSRGILHRQLALDGKTSVFDRAEVEELRLGRRAEQEGEMRTVLATGLTRVADEGLWIRGRDVVDLVGRGAGFVELAELVWGGGEGEPWPPLSEVLPSDGPTVVVGRGGRWPDPTALLERLRILVALAASGDPLRHDLSPRSVRAAGRRVITAMAAGLDLAADVVAAGASDPAGPIDGPPPLVETLWQHLTAQPAEATRLGALDTALAVLVDHGLATSTLAARVAASVRADPYSVVATGLGVLGGPLHGRATSSVHELYRAAEEGGAAAAVAQLQRRGLAVPGFGHSVYQAQDPRYGAVMGRVVDGWADDPRLATVFQVRDIVGQRSAALPNVDLATGALTFLAGMPANAGEALFAVARTAGWLAHAMEEYEEKPLRFRTRARYIGPAPE